MCRGEPSESFDECLWIGLIPDDGEDALLYGGLGAPIVSMFFVYGGLGDMSNLLYVS